jgi:hypothetical protein
VTQYSLTLTGELLPGADRAVAVTVLAAMLKLSAPQAESLLNGRPRTLRGPLSAAAAEQVRCRCERAGVVALVRPLPTTAAAVPATAAEVWARPSRFEVAALTSRCPNCGEEQPEADLCRRCGIVFAKFGPARPALPTARAASASTSEPEFPFKVVTQLVLLVFLSSLGVALWSHWKKAQLPAPAFYDQAQLAAPRQTPTTRQPFTVQAQGILYTIEPLYDYVLEAVVVSLHDSDVFWDIYHFKDWQDFINIRDLCVVWGANVRTDAFRAMSYSNTTWTCWVGPRNDPAAQWFAWDQLSNNHLLSADPQVQRAIKSAVIGDQIRLTGQLARYSHGGGFQRGTSTTRTDQGNGACETVYVERFEIIRPANPGWRLVYRLSLVLLWGALLGLVVLFFVAPVRGLRR